MELKLVLMGHVGAGKTRLLNRMLCSFRGASLGAEVQRRQHDQPPTFRQGAGLHGNESDGDEREEGDCEPTVGANYLVKLISLYGTSVKCSLWDVTGTRDQCLFGRVQVPSFFIHSFLPSCNVINYFLFVYTDDHHQFSELANIYLLSIYLHLSIILSLSPR